MAAVYKSVRLITWLIALLLFVAILTQLPFSSLSETVSRLESAQWLLWILVNLLTILMLVIRWQILIRATGQKTGLVPLLLVRQAGQLVSFITPGPQFGGEPLMVYWLWKNYRLPGSTALLVVGLDRFMELWVNFAILFLAVLLLLVNTTVDAADWQGVAGVLAALVLLLSLSGVFLIRHPAKMSALLQRISTRWRHHPILGKLDSEWNLISQNLRELVGLHKMALVWALVFSLLGWAGMIIELWLLMSFFVPAPDFSGFIVLFVAMRLAFLLPLPGGIGTLEAAVYWAIHGWGLPASVALGLIVLMRLRDAFIMLCALFALRHLNRNEPP